MNSAPTATENPAAVIGEAAAVSQAVVRAWAAADADAFAAVFTEDGTMILPGSFAKGREAIAGFMREGFAGPYRGTTVTGTPIDGRLLGPDTVLLITEGGVLEAGRTEVSTEQAIRASWLVVRRDGEWRLAAYHNCPRDRA